MENTNRKNNRNTGKPVRIDTNQVEFRVKDAEILKGITLQVYSGELVGLIGPNGCGKTTLLKNIYRLHKPNRGTVLLDGQSVHEMSAKSAARKMAVLAQEYGSGFDFSVIEIIMMGRFAHKKILANDTAGDREICMQALAMVGLSALRDRSFISLSGGEKQRVLLASAFAQETEIIILDEPTNHLDIGYQLLIMDILKAKKGTTIFASMHDMNIAARYCDRLIAMDAGKIIASGTPADVLVPDLMRRLFHVETRIEQDPASHTPHITFLGAVSDIT